MRIHPNNRCRGIYFRLCLHVDGCLSMLTPTKDGLLPSMAILCLGPPGQ